MRRRGDPVGFMAVPRANRRPLRRVSAALCRARLCRAGDGCSDAARQSRRLHWDCPPRRSAASVLSGGRSRSLPPDRHMRGTAVALRHLAASPTRGCKQTAGKSVASWIRTKTVAPLQHLAQPHRESAESLPAMGPARQRAAGPPRSSVQRRAILASPNGELTRSEAAATGRAGAG